MFTGDPNTKEPFNSWIERTLLKSEPRSTARSQRQRLKNELKISMAWVRNFYFLKISTVIKISTVFSLLLSVFKLNFNISECLRFQAGKTGQEIKKLHVNRIRESVSFNLVKKYRKMFAVLSRAWDIEKILSLHEETNLRPLDSALRCSTTEKQTSRWTRSITKFIWRASCILCIRTKISNVL